MEGLELACFQIISAVGMARSLFIEAIKEAKKENFDEAIKKIKEGEEYFVKGHSTHSTLIQQEANKNSVVINLLLVHAEDQLMSAESFKILADEFIDVYKKIKSVEDKK